MPMLSVISIAVLITGSLAQYETTKSASSMPMSETAAHKVSTYATGTENTWGAASTSMTAEWTNTWTAAADTASYPASQWTPSAEMTTAHPQSTYPAMEPHKGGHGSGYGHGGPMMKHHMGKNVQCVNVPVKMDSGSTLMEIQNYISSMDMMHNHTINQYGCFQVDCIGMYGALKLCNLKEKTETAVITAEDVRMALMKLMKKFRPNWMMDRVYTFLNSDALVMSGCGMGENMGHMGGEYGGKGGMGWGMKGGMEGGYEGMGSMEAPSMTTAAGMEMPTESGKTGWGDEKEWGMKRGKDMPHEKMHTAMSCDRVTGVVVDTMKGWALAIDGLKKGMDARMRPMHMNRSMTTMSATPAPTCQTATNYMAGECRNSSSCTTSWYHVLPRPTNTHMMDESMRMPTQTPPY